MKVTIVKSVHDSNSIQLTLDELAQREFIGLIPLNDSSKYMLTRLGHSGNRSGSNFTFLRIILTNHSCFDSTSYDIETILFRNQGSTFYTFDSAQGLYQWMAE